MTNPVEDFLNLNAIHARDTRDREYLLNVRRQNQVDRWPPDLRDGLVHHVGC